MAKQQSTQKLVNELEQAVEQSKKLLKVQNDLSKVIEDTAKELKDGFGTVSKDSTKGLAEFNKLLEQTNKLLKVEEKNNQEKKATQAELLKQEQEKSKLRVQLIKEQQAELRLQKQLKKEREDAQKALEKAQKTAKDENEAYKKQSKRLNELRNSYKNLAVEGKENTKVAKGLLKQITKLDKELKDIDETVGQAQRSVGSYSDALKGLEDQMEGVGKTAQKIGIFLILEKVMDSVKTSFGSGMGAMREFNILMLELEVRGEVWGKKLVSLFGGAKKVFDGLINYSKNVVTELKILGKELKISLTIGETPILDAQLKALKDSIIDVSKAQGLMAEGQKEISEAWNKESPDIKKIIEDRKKLLEQQDEFFVSSQKLERQLSVLRSEQANLATLAEDDTRSFEMRRKYFKEWEQTTREILKLDSLIATQNLDYQTKQIKTALDAVGINNDRIKSYEDLNKMLVNGNKELVDSLSTDQIEAFTMAYAEYFAVVGEGTEQLTDINEKYSKALSDEYELNLDTLIDGADNRKTVNERIIADETVSLNKRILLAEKTEKMMSKSYENQLKTVNEFQNKRIDLLVKNGDVTDEQADTLREMVSIENLRNLNSQEQIDNLNQQLRSLGLGEKFELRTLEIVRERNVVMQDVKESYKEIAEEARKLASLESDILSQEEILNILTGSDSMEEVEGKLADARQKRSEERLKQLKKEFYEVEAGSTKEAELIVEINEIEIELEKKKIAEKEKLQDEEDQKDADRLEKRKELFDAFNTYVDNAFTKSNEKRNNQIEADLTATESRIQQIQASAEAGNEEAKKSLAHEERKQAELKRKQEEQRKREQKQEAIIAGLKLLGANADQPNALGKTISDYTALVSIISSLPAFIEGTEKVSDGVKGATKLHDGTDGYLARFDGDERILNPKQNKMLGNLTNEEVAQLGKMHRMGELETSPIISGYDKGLKSEVTAMRGAIENLHKKIPIQRVDYDAKAKEHIHTISYNNKVQKLRSKANNVWR